MVSITGSASCTPGVARTVSSTFSENPDSPAVICSVALPASFSTVARRESSKVALPVRIAKNTATPSAMPRVVNATRSRCARHCLNVMSHRAPNITVLPRARSRLPLRPVRTSLTNLAVAQRQDSIAESRGKVIVRDQQNRVVVFAVKIVEQAKNFLSGGRIEIAGGFIAQQNGRTKDQGAGDGHALALASGKLVGTMVRPDFEPHALQHGRGALLRFAPPQALQAAAAGRHFRAR